MLLKKLILVAFILVCQTWESAIADANGLESRPPGIATAVASHDVQQGADYWALLVFRGLETAKGLNCLDTNCRDLQETFSDEIFSS